MNYQIRRDEILAMSDPELVAHVRELLSLPQAAAMERPPNYLADGGFLEDVFWKLRGALAVLAAMNEDMLWREKGPPFS
jgi:hypothetical protein